MKILLFDIDGTLLLTGGAGRIAFDKCFEEVFGIEQAWKDVVPDGKTDPLIIDEIAKRVLRMGMTEKEYGDLVKRYCYHFEREIVHSPRFRLMPGITELLEALKKEQTFHMGLATGNFEKPAWQKVERAHLRHYFKFGGFGSDSRNRVELTQRALIRGQESLSSHEKVEAICVIGDTVHDVRAGKALGALTFAVTTGSTSQEELSDAQPDYLMKDFSDTHEALRLFRKL